MSLSFTCLHDLWSPPRPLYLNGKPPEMHPRLLGGWASDYKKAFTFTSGSENERLSEGFLLFFESLSENRTGLSGWNERGSGGKTRPITKSQFPKRCGIPDGPFSHCSDSTYIWNFTSVIKIQKGWPMALNSWVALQVSEYNPCSKHTWVKCHKLHNGCFQKRSPWTDFK